jgi:citrate lyase subunit beta / citryl-CoA lyase
MSKRPPELRRTWLFVGGADDGELAAATNSRADVIALELEDFTPPTRRAEARAKAARLFDTWRAAGKIAAVRINPLETDDGLPDLSAVMEGRPDVVMLPKVAEPHQVERLDARVSHLERDLDLAAGSTELVPNIELARGLMQTYDICRSSPRVTACLVASEDMAADLGAERGPDGIELNYVRERFLLECVAARTVAIDCPYTWTDAEGVERDTRHACRLGFKAKSLVNTAHVDIINGVLTPSTEDAAQAERVVAAFEAAQAAGDGRAELDGSLVEWPIYLNAKRLLERAGALAGYE